MFNVCELKKLFVTLIQINNKQNIIMEELRVKADEKVRELIAGKYYTKTAIANKLDISLSTLWTRFKECNWTGEEINIIMEL